MLKLYENIKLYRKEAGWTQQELAKKAGYTDRSSIAKIESGVVDLSESKIKQFADIFGVSQGELMGFEKATEETQKNSEAIADLASRMLVDTNFFSLVNDLSKLDESRLQDAKDMLNLLFKQSLNQNEN